MISVWNGPRQTLSHTMTSLLMLPSGDPPLAPSSGVSAPSEAGMAVPNWQNSSRASLIVDPRCGEAVYLALTANVDKSADSAGPHNQRDPSSEIGLIGHHQEHRILIISCNTSHLHTKDDKPEWASTHFT